jgi:hypothetical protein
MAVFQMKNRELGIRDKPSDDGKMEEKKERSEASDDRSLGEPRTQWEES